MDPTNPLNVLKINNTFRRLSDREDDLFPLDEVCKIKHSGYAPYVSTLLMEKWKTGDNSVNQARYNQEIFTKYPVLVGVLPMEGVVIAGGGASFPFWGNKERSPGDIDFFLYGPNANWKTVGALIKKLR